MRSGGQLELIENIRNLNTNLKTDSMLILNGFFLSEKERGSRSRSPEDGMNQGDMRNVLRRMKESKTSPGRPAERHEKVIMLAASNY